MAISATIYEAKTNFSELVKRAQAGESVIITSGRERTPVARLEAIDKPRVQRLGAWATPGFELTDAFWEPMTDEECGYGDTHTLLWANLEPRKLSQTASDMILNPVTTVFVSAASAWEIATKVRLGKLPGAEVFELD